MMNPSNPHETSRKLKILLTEDNLVNRVLAQKLLQKYGHTVALANNGKEGATLWEANRSAQFDLILMDIQMPLMDGLQATMYIRAQEKALQAESTLGTDAGLHIPIVAMTAHAMKGDRERYLAGGMDGYISKPINSAELERVIQSVVASSTPTTPVPSPDLSSLPQERPWTLQEAELLARFDGDIDLVRELGDIFVKECPKYLNDIDTAIRDGNSTDLEHAAHALKGSVGNFSIKGAYESSLELETLGRRGSVSGASEIFQILREQLEQFNLALTGLIKQTVGRTT
jgi:CheY-like chemotaxis protein